MTGIFLVTHTIVCTYYLLRFPVLFGARYAVNRTKPCTDGRTVITCQIFVVDGFRFRRPFSERMGLRFARWELRYKIYKAGHFNQSRTPAVATRRLIEAHPVELYPSTPEAVLFCNRAKGITLLLIP